MNALNIETTVLPGRRLEIGVPELPEGAKVEVFVVLRDAAQPERISVLEFVEYLPPGPHAFPTWEEYEKHLQEEKDAWER
jgi:hypothetical protein